MSYLPEPAYCPLCGAHEIEHGEGEVDDKALLLWAEQIEALYTRLKQVQEST